MIKKSSTAFAMVMLVLFLFLSACNPPTPNETVIPTPVQPTAPPPTDQPATQPPAPTKEVPATEVEPTATLELTAEAPSEPPASQQIEFMAEDGTQLMGTYYPPLSEPAPAVILMHQFGSNRTTWGTNGMAAWLQNPSVGQDELWPATETMPSLAVFSFDFRGHGDSGGSKQGERADFLSDAKAALTTVKELPGVDPQKIILIGASIGADAAIDVCIQGCLGALSFSPGSYLDVSYPEVVAELGLDQKPAWCLAAEDDNFSADTCKSAAGESYRSIIYAQGGHGEALIKSGMDPDIGELVVEFFSLVLGGSP